MAGKYFWLKERYNPQLGTYYVPCGQITVSEAYKMENASYGENFMHKYESEEEYNKAINDLKAAGEKVN